MTIDPVKESQYWRSQSHSEINAEDVPEFREKTMMRSIQPKKFPAKQAGDDRERNGSSETTLYKSPRSGEKVESWTNNFGVIHHQILKIREEDSHLGDDFREGLSTKEKLAVFHLASQMDSLILSRPILPCSPLSGKTAIKT